jgi:hypothetical protein
MAYNEPTGGRAQVGGTPLDTFMNQARNPLQEAINLFRRGGGFGAGQNALIEEQAKRDKAEALSNQVASGMSSGSLATSTGLRIGRDVATQKLGVEDTRTQFLSQALQALSGLYGQFAGLNTQRDLGMAGIRQNQAASEMAALSNVAANRPQASRGAGGGIQMDPWSTFNQPSQVGENPGYNIPRF